MKHSILAFVAALFVAIPANATLTVSEGCYQIGSADDLYELAELYRSTSLDDELAALLKCAELTQDIVVNENVLKEDGTPNAGPFRKWKPMMYFAGTFDGHNHTISGLYQVDTASSVGFLVGWKGSLTVKNLGIVDSYFASEFEDDNSIVSAGGLVTWASDTMIIDNCFSAATVEMYAQSDAVGGLVGGADTLLIIRNSYNVGKVLMSKEKMEGLIEDPRLAPVGGLVGYSNSYSEVRIENSYNAGPITGIQYAGGLVGMSGQDKRNRKASRKLVIEGSYNSGNINTLENYIVGGLVGEGMGVIKESYNVGTVSGGANVGGLVGSVSWDSLRIENSFNRGTLVSRGNLIDLEELKKEVDEITGLAGGLVGLVYDSEVLISNSYSASENYSAEESVNSVIGMVEASLICFDNVFYRKSLTAKNTIANIGLFVYDEALFNNGVVATQLHAGNEIWGQKLTGEGTFPDLSGTVNAVVKTSPIAWNSFEGDTNSYPATYIEGSELVLPGNIQRTGYLFDGWYAVANPTDADSRIDRIDVDETGEKTFYAKWLRIKTPRSDGSCYLIFDVADLYSFASIVNGTNGMEQESDACGILAQNIVVNEQVLDSEGYLNAGRAFRKWIPMEDFSGTFDGAGHTIYGLYVNDYDMDEVGLFGSIYHTKKDTAEIKNLGLEDFYFRGWDYVGAFVGRVTGSNSTSRNGVTITNSHSNGVVVGYKMVGGFIGSASRYAGISNSYNLSRVKGDDDNVGGFIGNVNGADAYIFRSYNSGLIRGHASGVGGMVGRTYSSGTQTISQSYNEGYVRGSIYVGGIVGEAEGSTHVRIVNSYNKGFVGGGSDLGGLIGIGHMGYGSTEICNSYNVGKIIPDVSIDVRDVGALIGRVFRSDNSMNNSFYLKQEGIPAFTIGNGSTAEILTGWTEASEEQLYDGTVAALLHNWVELDTNGVPVKDGSDGLVWAIDPSGTHVLPHLDWENKTHRVELVLGGGKIAAGHELTTYEEGVPLALPDSQYVTREGYYFVAWYDNSYYNGSPKTSVDVSGNDMKVYYAKWEMDSTLISSSSEPESSSSEVSSSSEGSSSSSSTPSSSSATSSSSSVESSSSSKGKDALQEFSKIPQFSVSVINRSLQVAGARVGDRYVLFDMQGNVVLRGTANSANFSIAVPVSGHYVLRIGYGTRKVAVGN